MTDKIRADNSLTKSDLSLLEKMSQELASGNRIEIRGFGSFSLHFRAARMGRNPKSGDAVPLRGKYVPHFKPGKELRERVNNHHTPLKDSSSSSDTSQSDTLQSDITSSDTNVNQS